MAEDELQALRKRVDELYLITQAQSVAIGCLVPLLPGAVEVLDRAAVNLEALMLSTDKSDEAIAFCKECLLAIAHAER